MPNCPFSSKTICLDQDTIVHNFVYEIVKANIRHLITQVVDYIYGYLVSDPVKYNINMYTNILYSHCSVPGGSRN